MCKKARSPVTFRPYSKNINIDRRCQGLRPSPLTLLDPPQIIRHDIKTFKTCVNIYENFLATLLVYALNVLTFHF